MHTLKDRFKFHLLFWKSTFPISFAVSCGLMYIASSNAIVSLNLLSILKYMFFYLPAGLIFAILYKEISHKEEYYFYYNQGISRIELWIGNVLIFFSLFLFTSLLEWIWKIC